VNFDLFLFSDFFYSLPLRVLTGIFIFQNARKKFWPAYPTKLLGIKSAVNKIELLYVAPGFPLMDSDRKIRGNRRISGYWNSINFVYCAG
jgi:hypothetical protein